MKQIEIDIINKFWELFRKNKKKYKHIKFHCSLQEKLQIINSRYTIIFDDYIIKKKGQYDYIVEKDWTKLYRLVLFYDIYSYELIAFLFYYKKDSLIYERILYTTRTVNYNKFAMFNILQILYVNNKFAIINLLLKYKIRRINSEYFYFLLMVNKYLRIPDYIYRLILTKYLIAY